MGEDRIAVVMITRDGRARIGRSLERLLALPERPRVVVVDNASRDGTPELVAERYPAADLVRLGRNRGAAGRNVGVERAGTPYVAFAEDDSWYEPGALRRAVDLLDRHPRLGLVNAHTLVGPERRPDPVHEDMVDTPLPDERGLPGHPLVSFMEGVAILRARAFREVGGFEERLGVAGPEELLATELLAAGWRLRYVPEIVARHLPDHGAPSAATRRQGVRNTLWWAWLRRPWPRALRWSLHVVAEAPASLDTVRAVAAALAGLPWVRRARRVVPPSVEARLAALDRQKMRSRARDYGSG